MAISTYLTDVWSAVYFDDPALSGYVEIQMQQDTRLAVQALAGLALVMLFVAISLVEYSPVNERQKNT